MLQNTPRVQIFIRNGLAKARSGIPVAGGEQQRLFRVIKKYGISDRNPFQMGCTILVCAPVSQVSVTAVKFGCGLLFTFSRGYTT